MILFKKPLLAFFIVIIFSTYVHSYMWVFSVLGKLYKVIKFIDDNCKQVKDSPLKHVYSRSEGGTDFITHKVDGHDVYINYIIKGNPGGVSTTTINAPANGWNIKKLITQLDLLGTTTAHSGWEMKVQHVTARSKRGTHNCPNGIHVRYCDSTYDIYIDVSPVGGPKWQSDVLEKWSNEARDYCNGWRQECPLPRG